MGGLPREALRTARLMLREPIESDIPDVVASVADPLIRRFLPHTPASYGAGDARDWICRRAPKTWADGGACLVLTDPDRDRLLGSVTLIRTHRTGGRAELTGWLAPWARGQGYAVEAVTAVTAWALRGGLARLEFATALDNPASQRVALASGYRREGVMRGAGSRPDGTRYDTALWARLATDPEGPTPRLLRDLPGGELSDGVVALHPLGPDDTDDQYAAWLVPDIANETVPPGTPSRSEVACRCAEAPSQWLAGSAARLTIRDAPSDVYAGEITLLYTEPPTLSGMLGYHLLPDWRGRGFATRAVRLLADWALGPAGLARLEAGVNVTNAASQKVLVHAGFHRVGLQRARRAGPDGPIDDYLYELVADR